MGFIVVQIFCLVVLALHVGVDAYYHEMQSTIREPEWIDNV
jgi:hypothetical protein